MDEGLPIVGASPGKTSLGGLFLFSIPWSPQITPRYVAFLGHSPLLRRPGRSEDGEPPSCLGRSSTFIHSPPNPFPPDIILSFCLHIWGRIVSAPWGTNLSQWPELSPMLPTGWNLLFSSSATSLQSHSWACGLSGTLEPEVLATARSGLYHTFQHHPKDPLGTGSGGSVKVVFWVFFSSSRCWLIPTILSFTQQRQAHSGETIPISVQQHPWQPRRISPPSESSHSHLLSWRRTWTSVGRSRESGHLEWHS